MVVHDGDKELYVHVNETTLMKLKKYRRQVIDVDDASKIVDEVKKSLHKSINTMIENIRARFSLDDFVTAMSIVHPLYWQDVVKLDHLITPLLIDNVSRKDP